MNVSQALELAIAAGAEAMHMHLERDAPADWASAALNQGNRYLKRIEGSLAANLEESIRYLKAALGVFAAGAFGPEVARAYRDDDNPYWSDRMVQLAPTVRVSRQQGQEIYSKSDYIRDFASALNRLGSTFKARLLGDPSANIETAIHLFGGALKVFTSEADPRSRAMAHTNLGNAYQIRIVGKRQDNLTQAVRHHHRAVVLHRQGSSSLDVALAEQNLGAGLVTRALTFPARPAAARAFELEQAIELLERALTVRSSDEYPLQWSMTQMTLALAYAHRLEGIRTENVDRSIHLLEETLERVNLEQEYPQGCARHLTALGRVYLERHRDDEVGLAAPIRHLSRAVEIFDAHSMLRSSLPAREALATALLAAGRSADAYDHLATSLRKIQESRELGAWPRTRRFWLEEADTLFDRMVEVCWEHRSGEALVWSESGRGRSLAEASALRSGLLSSVDHAEYQEWLDLRAYHDQLERVLGIVDEYGLFPPAAPLREIQQVQARLRELDHHFEPLHPNPTSIHPLTLEEIVDTAALTRSSLLILRVTEAGCFSWLVTPDGLISNLCVEELNWARLRQFLVGDSAADQKGWLNAYLQFQTSRRRGLAKWLRTMDRKLKRIWEMGLEKVHAFVAAGLPPQQGGTAPPPLILVTSQSLGLLPLHAAWRIQGGARRYWCEDYILSYAPTVAALRHAMKRSSAGAGESGGFLGVADPDPTPGRQLPWSVVEVLQVAAQFPADQRALFGAPGNPQGWPPSRVPEVLENLRSRHGVVHLACHGICDLLDPWQRTGLFLTDAGDTPNLTLVNLATLDLPGCALAILSACETAMTNPGDVTDDFIGLPTAFLMAGARTVYGSLWTISDVATALIVTRACREVIPFAADSPGYAFRLWQAQQWLRTASHQDLRDSIEALSYADTRTRRTSSSSKNGPPGHLPFAHPFWWAGLISIGRP